MKHLLCILAAPALLLSGCTDIRERLLPDLLAVDTGLPVRFAVHASQDEAVITAAAESALLMPEALQNTAGTEISTGHLTMLAVSGNPCAVIEEYLQAQYLAPTCTVLCVPRSACSMLKNGTLPSPAEIQTAADTGMLPCRTADSVIGDLWGGSGVTALPATVNGSLTLIIADRQQTCGTLSEDACRGLALLCGRWKTFAFTAEETAYRLRSSRFALKIVPEQGHLLLTVSGAVTAEPPLSAAAYARLTDMLQAAVTETAIRYGADILFLHETALHDGITDAAVSQEMWRDQLRNAEYRIILAQPSDKAAAEAACPVMPARLSPAPA